MKFAVRLLFDQIQWDRLRIGCVFEKVKLTRIDNQIVEISERVVQGLGKQLLAKLIPPAVVIAQVNDQTA